MSIGTSLGAYFDDAFHQSAAQWDPKYDTNEVGPDEATQSNPAKVTEVGDKGGTYSGLHPEEGTPEYDDWNKTWSEIVPLKGQSPEDFMKLRRENEEGTFHKGMDSMILRSKPKPALDVPMSSNEAKIIPVADKSDAISIKPVEDKPLEEGNIDLNNRPMVPNGDKISTVLSKSFNFDGKETLLPTVSDDGRLMSDDEAIQQYKTTGKHLGIFDSPESANSYAVKLHNEQAQHYLGDPQPSSITDKLFGLNGEERHQLWPERMIRSAFTAAHDVMSGNTPMWAYDPQSGEYHTSIEGIEKAQDLAPFALSGAMPTRIHLRGEGPKAIEDLQASELTPTAREEMWSRVRRMPEFQRAQEEIRSRNDFRPDIRRPAEDATDRALRAIHEALYPEQTSRPRDPFQQEPFDHVFENNVRGYADDLHAIRNAHEDAGSTWEPQGIRQGESYEAFARRTIDRTPPSHTEADLADFHNQERLRRDNDFHTTIEHEPQVKSYVNEQIEAAKKQDKLTLIKDTAIGYGARNFRFANKDGVGRILISEKNGGKELYVNSITTSEGKNVRWGPQNFGVKEIRSLLEQIRDEYPDAESISGFRVSGVRGKHSVPANAEMKLPKRK